MTTKRVRLHRDPVCRTFTHLQTDEHTALLCKSHWRLHSCLTKENHGDVHISRVERLVLTRPFRSITTSLGMEHLEVEELDKLVLPGSRSCVGTNRCRCCKPVPTLNPLEPWETHRVRR